MSQTLKYGLFQVEIDNDQEYMSSLTDNKNTYNFVYANKTTIDSLSSKYSVKVFSNGCLYKSAILAAGGGGITSVHQTSALIDGDNLIIILGDSLFNLHLPDLLLNSITTCDDSLCFGIYKIADGYVTHGELSISKINQFGKIEWQFYGSEIFATPDGVNDFIVKEDRILAKDWADHCYEINLDGREIKNDNENR